MEGLELITSQLDNLNETAESRGVFIVTVKIVFQCRTCGHEWVWTPKTLDEINNIDKNRRKFVCLECLSNS